MQPLDFLKKAKKTEIIAFTAMVCIGIIVAYYFIFLTPVVSKLSYLLRESSKVQTNINKAELTMKALPKVKSEIEQLRSKEAFYGTKLPREEEFPAVLESLSTMARDTGVKITKILPMKDLKAAQKDARLAIYNQQAILVDAQCGYHELGTFIAELENAERFMEVSDIRIEAGGVNPKRHNIQLIVKTFILKGESK